jgi:hypothetical protein
MAKKNKRLVSKKTKKKVKAATPWAVAGAAVAGMIAAIADRTVRGKVKSLAAETLEKAHLQKKSEANGIAMVPQESGAV